MIYLNLFLTFLKIGLVAFGGGYSMIPLVQQAVVDNGWLTIDEFLNFLAISESTPGPIAVNMATFVGSSQGGILGAALATVGVVLPAFIIILLVSVFIKKLLQYSPVKAAINGIKPVIVSLILGAAVTLGLSIIFGIKNISSSFNVDYFAIIIFSLVVVVSLVYKKLMKKSISPILLILFSGVLGILFYGL